MTVLLREPIACAGSGEPSMVIGYVVVVGVNASDLLRAVEYAHAAAMRPKSQDGTIRSFDGVVVEAQVARIEKTDWDPENQENATRSDEEGVYWSSGLVFFGDESKTKTGDGG